MEGLFDLQLCQDRLTAQLNISHKPVSGFSITVDELLALLKEKEIVYGIRTEVLDGISKDSASVEYPVTIAEGLLPVNGEDAYLRNEMRDIGKASGGKINFRNVLDIASVKQGQLLASVVPAGNGVDGIDVCGRTIKARDGKPLAVKPGANVVFTEGKFFAANDGQLSISRTRISVNPVFEVPGDLDLKTGNIDFIGNIVIRGNVPGGYQLKAGGDIRIFGVVEASHIEAQGDILIEGGIAGGLKGSINAGGNVQAAYLNHAVIKAGHNVIVKSSIVQSKIIAGGEIDCRSGHVVGGLLTAGKNIYVKELGNRLFTKTELAVGWDPALDKQAAQLRSEIEAIAANIKKLTEIESKLLQVLKTSGQLSAEQVILVKKQRATRLGMEKELAACNERLAETEEDRLGMLKATLSIYDKVYPNTKIYFGKYAYTTNQTMSNVQFFFDDGEIQTKPIV
ncbi:DUF342 domain-containing protein [Bacillus sp. T33-2]|uniref:DUF342 domain-containing protein n=1 Tax=Bacillus sp. T33-2 TaxID=2054168 RepID=UPI000C7686BC|nr:FapA family protein [Bacillus sp. T33-2]PLR97253.1 hypothetical protein CVD19_07110 [Bacillus sp. T33-2]